MSTQPPSPDNRGETNSGLSPTQVTEPVDSPATEPATAQQLQEVEKQMSGFEKATLKWAKLAVGMSLVAAVFVCLQWYEMHTGGQDTHDLAVAAGKQADKMKDMSDAADKIRQAAEGMVTQEKRLADDTENSLRSSSKQSSDALNASIAASRSDQRAWMGSADWSFNVSASDPIKSTVAISNLGKSPAMNVTCRIDGGAFPKAHALSEADITYPDRIPILKEGTVFPSQRFPLTATGDPMEPESQEAWFQYIESGSLIEYFWGYVTYDDAFGRKHWTHFCTEYRPKTKDGAPCAIYTDTDDVKKNPN